jgi:hypothetical protein
VPAEDPPDVLVFAAAAFFARAAAFGPSAGSFPAAIWAANRPPTTRVTITAIKASLTVSALVDWRGGRRYLR